MPRAKFPGTCLFCRNEFDKAVMSRHLAKCTVDDEREHMGNKKYVKRTLYLLQVQTKYSPVYWLSLEMQSKAPLLELDSFLRDIWLECCGHMSAFEFVKKKKGKRTAPLKLLSSGGFNLEDLESFFDDPDEIDMGTEMAEIWTPKCELKYEYDFGTTTELKIKMVSERIGLVKPKATLRLLARNHNPIVPCGYCGAPATKIDTENSYARTGWMCDQCWKKQLDDGDAFESSLPVVNSPRTGECGYCGSSKTNLGEPLPTFALPDRE